MDGAGRTSAGPRAGAARRAEDTAWGRLEWLAGRAVGNADGVTLGRVRIRRGSANPRHAHRNCEEVLYLLAGRLRHSVGDGAVALEPGQVIVIPAGVFHNAQSVGDVDADMIVAYSSGERDFVPEEARQ